MRLKADGALGFSTLLTHTMTMDLSLHIPVFREQFRSVTNFKTGLVQLVDVIRLYRPDVFGDGLNSLWLGNEFPLYEVAMDGGVYRMLIRERSGTKDAYEVIRIAAPGYTADGFLLEPAPDTVPNTPIALLREIAYVTGNSLTDVARRAYSLMDYRKCHGAKYPAEEQPEQFRFEEWFLLALDGEEVSSLFDTPPGTNAEVWTIFLKVLETRDAQRVMDFVASGASREFGERAAAPMMKALRVRNGLEYTPRNIAAKSLLASFPLPDGQSSLRRTGPSTKVVSRDSREMLFSFNFS